MPYVKRNSEEEVIAISQSPDKEFSELLEKDDPAILKFIELVGDSQTKMAESDLDFIRVVEDLIDVLVAKNYILFTDLPEKAQEKMRDRRSLRGKLATHLDLFSDDEGFF
ncbi:tryptophan synthase subunit beta like protein [Teredinibacter franksiae]|uniref:tryptophan synthase subunit beta like protein n=1 Tax=Teredinibacter franksiae TaxID=2761453 RepID=UPI001623708B|nr:tryptophan synthase subunit beta like protein [Teredinibacter franksiae]